MARKLRSQPGNVCYHVVTRIAHREFFFDETEKEIVVQKIRNVERFTDVMVLAYAVMSNHLHLLLFIEKPPTLMACEDAGYFLGYDFEPYKEGEVYRVNEYHVFTQAEVDEMRRLGALSALERYEMTLDELVARLRVLMRPRAFEHLMAEWAKMSPAAMDAEYERHLMRMYDLSAFMKILKQDISQYYNVRHNHTGGLWEGRFKDSILERSVDTLSSVSTYIDLNAWRAKMVDNPADYKWCGWNAAISGDETRRAGYSFIYDISSPWGTVAAIHQQQLEYRMAEDTPEQGEKEEAVFTSGAIVGTDAFVRRIVGQEQEVFPTGHKSAPASFTVGGKKLKTLRNLGILRGIKHG